MTFNAVEYIDKTIDEMWLKFKGAKISLEEARRLQKRLTEFESNLLMASLSDPAWQLEDH
jgi:hypothetical protein